MSARELALDLGRQFGGTASVSADVTVPRRRSAVLVDPRRRVLKTSLLLDVQQMSDGRWLATHGGIMTHGVGDTPEAAVRDFEAMLLDLFRELVESEAVLAAHLQDELENLRGILADSALD